MSKQDRSEIALHASLTRLINKYGCDRVVVRHRSGRRKSPNDYAKYVKANFKKVRKSGEDPKNVMKKLAKKWNASPKASGKRKRSGKRKASRK